MSPSDQFIVRSEPQTNSSFRIVPQLGGIMSSLILHGRELLYFKEDDSIAGISRGGNPILFPICGKVKDEQYEWNDKSYPMINHGFARELPWRITEGCGSSVTLQLRSTEHTMRLYPFEFELLFTYVLQDAKLTIIQQYRNLGNKEMPMYAGFHPYFESDSSRLEYITDAKSTLDANENEERPFTGIVDLTGKNTATLLIGATAGSITFSPIMGDDAIRMEYGPEFKYMMLWSSPGKPFVCVEPWMARSMEIYRKQELVILKPGEILHTFLSFSLTN